MTTFLDKKEQVLDIQLTSHGKYLLSAGKFKPVFYTFLDDNIIYDYKHANVHENQKDIHNRVTQDTQYLQTQTQFDSPEEHVKEKIEKIRSKVPLFFSEENDMGIEKELSHTNFNRKTYVFNNTIGSAPPTGRFAPAWQVRMIKGEISGSTPFINQPYELINIPQIDLEVTYDIKELSIHSQDDMFASNEFKEFFDEEFYMYDMHKSDVFNDDTFLQIFGEDPIIDIKELNSFNEIDNFDIEVYRVEENYNRKIGGNEKLVRLHFVKDKQEIVDGILVDDDGYNPETVPITTDNVEYYFNIQIDSDIDKRQLCNAIDKLKSENYFVDIPIDCEDEGTRQRMDIYGSSIEPEECD
jgi:hypothetical protein